VGQDGQFIAHPAVLSFILFKRPNLFLYGMLMLGHGLCRCPELFEQSLSFARIRAPVQQLPDYGLLIADNVPRLREVTGGKSQQLPKLLSMHPIVPADLPRIWIATADAEKCSQCCGGVRRRTGCSFLVRGALPE
ncbi:MAG TPA: hypothetical protein VH933_08425, partial [Aestuariivirgaceae bacterium]